LPAAGSPGRYCSNRSTTSNPDFGAVIFRRTHPEITNEGGLWDESMKLDNSAGARDTLNSGRSSVWLPSDRTRKHLWARCNQPTQVPSFWSRPSPFVLLRIGGCWRNFSSSRFFLRTFRVLEALQLLA